jgi:uncharacterized protein GlcG (DUF336 family)
MRVALKTSLMLALASLQVWGQETVYSTPNLTPETALRAAQAAMDACRKHGYLVSVAVVDRSGITQAFLRDRFAGVHTVTVATDKAWTAASFRNTTAQLMLETQAGKPMSGMRNLPRFMAVAGGVPLESAGALVGAIGVSGAPGGDADASCALEGQKAVLDVLDF